ncbi:MAG: tRNA (guanosine(37)-N1)-methyltransferase TrmD [Clostridia bacterium]|nr:tRNA (guanosine(37)-N1)-methyltransferase TrmD [Clostridia bacterium]
MKFYIMTLFPEMVMSGLNTSIIGRAMEKGLLEIDVLNIRDYANNKHGKVDDYPYGGGAGMLMQAEPVYLTYLEILRRMKVSDGLDESKNTMVDDNSLNQTNIDYEKKPRLVYLTPQGTVFSQSAAEDFSKEESLILLCGHYEGIDERVLEEIVTDYVSIGDYVLTGGELPAMVMVDAISRLIPGVLNNETSSEFESFQDGLLEYPQYSRPEEWRGKKVPMVLLSGHHANIEKWRQEQSLQRTKERRPDLLDH